MPYTDTTPVAQAVQLQILRAMSGEQRILLAFEMSNFARELAKAGIRREHPEWSEAQVARELLRLAFFPASLPSWVPAVGESARFRARSLAPLVKARGLRDDAGVSF